MGKTIYTAEPANASKSCKAAGTELRTHYKNMYNVTQAIKGMEYRKAVAYLEAVLEKKRYIPIRRYTGCIGRTPQAKEFKHTQGRWPQKSVKMLLNIMKNAEANAETKNLDSEKLFIKHLAVNCAPQGRRRTYRAHGRISAYCSSPAHVQMILEEKEEGVEKPEGVKK